MNEKNRKTKKINQMISVRSKSLNRSFLMKIFMIIEKTIHHSQVGFPEMT